MVNADTVKGETIKNGSISRIYRYIPRISKNQSDHIGLVISWRFLRLSYRPANTADKIYTNLLKVHIKHQKKRGFLPGQLK